MRLHRLVLTNYRGIAHRDLEFPDQGVVVVSGANEIGKTSMIEALDLLLEVKDRSRNKDVKAVKPTHLDAGTEVTAEISTGPYRFVYRKRFHKRPETELTISAPRREQYTGDEAHDRVCAMLAETLDTQLWHAQRVLQAGSTAAVDLSGCDALSRALDVAAGDAAALTGGEPVLMASVDSEYGLYFTGTGRPTGVWASARARLDDAEAELDRCAALVAEVEERAARHDELTGELAEVAARHEAAETEKVAALAAADTVTELTTTLRDAELAADAATSAAATARSAHGERQRLIVDADRWAATVGELQDRLPEAGGAATTARHDAAAAEAAAAQAAAELAAAEARSDAARRDLDRLTERAETDRLSDRLERIETTVGERDALRAELAAITMTEATLRGIEDAAGAVDRAEAALTAISATLRFTALADLEIRDGEERRAMGAGESWSTTATAATRLEVPGVLTVRVEPGADARTAEDDAAGARTRLAAVLADAGVADLAAAREADRRRRDLQSRCDQLGATVEALCGDDPIERLRERLERLRATQTEPEPGAPTDVDSARAALADAEAARTETAGRHTALQERAAEATALATERSTRATVVTNDLDTHRRQLAAATERLSEARERAGDDALAAAVEEAQRAATEADERVAELRRQLAAGDAETVLAERDRAIAAAEHLDAEHRRITAELRDIAVELAVIGTEGRHSRLDAAETEHAHAADEHARIGRRARAVELLRSVLRRYRDDTRRRYVEPFRTEIERLGRPVFGSSFEVDVDTGLRIVSRTLDGCTVPYDALSGGAKEQLGILTRLAGAALVAKEDSVPVLIDDALGFTDPQRLGKMSQVFDTVGSRGQVIVLTCTPERYQGIGDAHRIELTG
ncbi:hypothetical protein AWC30_02570 [Mycolicibacillus trivialis]|uniref:Endonuclease GajA/Old nuclease/RecF-like AAA domain-containing protein n=2 Tax=Mycolicibacillus trivialis TaxID=1798 RepID=A0A1X2EQA5_9MYCO|nr:AAA family ATPase [Mycolicibacillus trivialis]ORX08314.1 hypothetical protein AWC30_02570 [Mycolicibacillus trivialis]